MVSSMKISFSSKVVEEIRPGCRNLQESLIMIKFLVIMVIIPWWDAIEIWFIRGEVQFGILFKSMVGQEFLL